MSKLILNPRFENLTPEIKGFVMSMSISAKGTNLFNYFAIAQENKIVIPEYQRPYAWESDHVQILFEDLWNYNKEHLNNSKAPPYFLGCIVSYKNDKDEQEIIDGQQRLTTLFLLFRAILAAIENFPVDPDLEAIVRKIKSSIYKNRGVADTPDPKQPLIESKVINQTYNNVLSDILENGLLKTGATDPYSTNYSLLLKLVKEVACKDRDCFYEIVDSLLKKTIVLPITTDSEETALTIFMTMNDRGLQLTDADIFKANIYSQKSELERKTFIDHWKKLEERGMNCKLSLQSLFTYFMFYLKALNGDKKGTIEGVRKFYLADPEKRLYQEDLIPQLNKIIDLWNVIFYRKNLDGELWTKDIKILKSLDTLRSYPNEWWKYPVICFYLRHRNANDFESFFGLFLKGISKNS